jgi:uncharacterized protein
MRSLPILLALLLLSACGSSDVMRPEDRGTRLVTLPNGSDLRVELRTNPEDILRGAMFRDAMPENRGLLMRHQKVGPLPTFLFQVKFPMDLIWLDDGGRIVEVIHNVPPCPEGMRASQCTVYGSRRAPARYVLLVAAGVAKKQNLTIDAKVVL